MFTLLFFLLIAPLLLFLLVRVWLLVWTAGIHKRAIRQTACSAGVSEAYVEAVVANRDDLSAGRIGALEWQRRAMEIAYQYPVESGLRDILREEEGLR